MEINIIKEDAILLQYRCLSVVYQHSPGIYKQFNRGEMVFSGTFTWKEGAQASRRLYIMLAFFEHFNETKASSIIRAF